MRTSTDYLLRAIPQRIYRRFKALAKANNTTVRATLIDYMAGATKQPRCLKEESSDGDEQKRE